MCNRQTLNLSIGHLNVRSLVPKFNILKNYLSVNGFDILALTETWLTHVVDDNELHINNFKLVRRDRGYGRGGGILLYIRSSLQYRILTDIHVTDCTEQIWVEFRAKGVRTVLGIFYRPPGFAHFSHFLEEFEYNISEQLLQCDNLLCLGDFNIDLYSLDSLYCQRFISILNAYNLSQVINEPTRVGMSKASLIDLILCLNNDFLISAGVDSTLNISDHLVIKCEVKQIVHKAKPFMIRYRDFRDFNEDVFYSDFMDIPFYEILYAHDIERKLKLFNTHLLNLYNKHAPMREAVISKKKAPWLTQEIKNLMKLRDKALSKYKKNKVPENWENYRQLRNRVTIESENGKKMYLENNVHPGYAKNNWKVLKDMNIYSKGTKEIPVELGSAEDINDYFINAANLENLDPNTLNFYLQNNKGMATFEFRLATIDDIDAAFRSIRSMAIGTDGIGLFMLHNCFPDILPIILHLVNSCIETSIFPKAWKSSFLLPIPKISNPTELKDLRPISILPTLSKVIERILENQVREYIELHKILPSTQSGFRKDHSCVTALLKVTDDILEATDRGELTALVLLDYSKAFDRLNHQLLLAILKYLGFSKDACKLIKSYLTGRTQCVKLNGQQSNSREVCNGVPQGSILGPLFFTLYTSQLLIYLRYVSKHCYADDTQIYLSFKPDNIQEANIKISHDLKLLIKASKAHCLSLNPQKCQMLLFGQPKAREQFKNQLNVIVDEQPLSCSISAKNLGLKLDVNLRFSEHVNGCIQRAFTNLKLIFNQRHLLSTNLKKLLCDSLVLSQFTYCDVLYGSCLLAQDAKRIQLIQNCCVRLIGGIRRYDRGVSAKLREVGWLDMKERRCLHGLVFYHRIIFKKSPGYLYQKIKFRYDSHNLDLRHKFMIAPPIHKTAIYERSFSYQVSVLYNRVPDRFRKLSILGFKKEMRSIISDFV